MAELENNRQVNSVFASYQRNEAKKLLEATKVRLRNDIEDAIL